MSFFSQIECKIISLKGCKCFSKAKLILSNEGGDETYIGSGYLRQSSGSVYLLAVIPYKLRTVSADDAKVTVNIVIRC